MLGTFPSCVGPGTGYIKNIQSSLDFICNFAKCDNKFHKKYNDPARLYVEAQSSSNAWCRWHDIRLPKHDWKDEDYIKILMLNVL